MCCASGKVPKKRLLDIKQLITKSVDKLRVAEGRAEEAREALTIIENMQARSSVSSRVHCAYNFVALMFRKRDPTLR